MASNFRLGGIPVGLALAFRRGRHSTHVGPVSDAELSGSGVKLR